MDVSRLRPTVVHGAVLNIGRRKMSAYDSRTKLGALRDHFETFGKGANYLLVGNGAGFVGSLSVVKDNPEKLPQQFQGIGLVVLLVGGGLLLGCLFWGMSMAIKVSVTQRIMLQQPPSKNRLGWLHSRFIELLAHLGPWGSLAAFVTAIILIMAQFRDALPSALLSWVGPQS
jgi:hypothetical protein